MKPKQIIAKPVAIYLIKNDLNDNVYIGQSVNPKARWAEHRNCRNGGRESKLYNAINKYGIDKFEFTILCYCKDKQEANKVEIRLIAELDTRNSGYNITIGGEGTGSGKDHPRFGTTASDDTRKLMSESRKGQKRSLEFIYNQKHRMKGIKPSKETMAKVIGVPKTREHKLKLSVANKNKSITKEHKEKIQNNRPTSKITVLIKDIERLEFISGNEAARYLGVSQNSIARAIRKNYKVRGWTPQYIEAT